MIEPYEEEIQNQLEFDQMLLDAMSRPIDPDEPSGGCLVFTNPMEVEVTVRVGHCSSCGQPAVWTSERTYHPAATYDHTIPCVAKKMVEGTDDWPEPVYSFDILPTYFIEDK